MPPRKSAGAKLRARLVEFSQTLYRGDKELGPREWGVVLNPEELGAIESACSLADEIERMEAELKDAPLFVRGSRGQDVSNPLLAEVRQSRLAMDRLLHRVNWPIENAAAMSPSEKARHAAMARWSPGQVQLRWGPGGKG